MRLAPHVLLLPLLLWVAACSGAQPGQAAAPEAHGRALFRNKGCVTCHHNARVEGESGLLAVGPDLTGYQNDAEFLRQWLANPKAIKPATAMPDLELTDAEIEALIAFLNEPR